MKRMLLVLAFAAAACSPATTYNLPPDLSGYSPAEAQKIIDQATRQAVATEARQAALDRLADSQTQQAMEITAEFSKAALTVEARNAAAESTQNASRWLQNGLQTAAAATDARMSAQTTEQASRAVLARSEVDRQNLAEFWASVRTIFLGLSVVAGLTLAAVFAFDRITLTWIRRMAEQATIAREAFRVLPPNHWAEWRPDDGYHVYELPLALDEPAQILENQVSRPDRDHELRQAVRLFCWWGDQYGFTITDLGPRPGGKKVVTDEDWRTLSKLLKSLGILTEGTVPGKKGVRTIWADGWNYKRLHDDLAHGRVKLPVWPVDLPIPKVAFAVPTLVSA